VRLSALTALLLAALGCKSSAPTPRALDPDLDVEQPRVALIEIEPTRVYSERVWLERNAEASLSLLLTDVEPAGLVISAVDGRELDEPAGPGLWALEPGTRQLELELDPRGSAALLIDGPTREFEGLMLELPAEMRVHLEVGARYGLERPLSGTALVVLQPGGRYRLRLAVGYEQVAFGLLAEEAGWLYQRRVGPPTLSFALSTDEEQPRNMLGQGLEGLRVRVRDPAVQGDGPSHGPLPYP